MGIGGQLGIRDQFSGDPARAFSPEVDEARNFTGLFRFGHSGIGIAQHTLLGIPGQEDQDAFLIAVPAGDMVFLQRFLGEYQFPGFRPRATLKGIWGDRQVRIIELDRRQ